MEILGYEFQFAWKYVTIKKSIQITVITERKSI